MTTSAFGGIRSLHPGTASRAVRISMAATAIGAYLVLTSSAVNALFTSPARQVIPLEASPDAKTPPAEFSSGTAFDGQLNPMAVPSASSGVLTITVDGPNASVDLYCDPTRDGALLDRVHVTPGEMMDAFNRLCIPLQDS